MVFKGTIYASRNFIAEQGASNIEAAISAGSQIKIVETLTRINNAQRQQLKAAFKARTGKDMEEELKRFLKGDLEDGIDDVIVSLLHTPTQEDAAWLRKAVKGIGTNEKVLIEILCSRTNAEIAAIREEYERMFQRQLDNDIAKDTSGTLKLILTALSRGNRDESQDTDQIKAKEDGDRLYKAGEKKAGTDEHVFIEILTQESYRQLDRIFSEYEKLAGHSLGKAIDKEFSFAAKDALQTVFDVCDNKALYFAKRIHAACKGPGTRDRDLIRVLVARSEIDLSVVRAEFERLYGKTLYETLTGECSGPYLEALLALVKGNQNQ